jgi:hypothetical protein
MGWDIRLSAEFDAWFRDDLSDAEQETVVSTVELLKELDDDLNSPLVQRAKASRRRYLRELHPPGADYPVVPFTFDPKRAEIVLLAGDRQPD